MGQRANFIAVAKTELGVIEALARFYLSDGNLSSEEINAAFAKVDKKASA